MKSIEVELRWLISEDIYENILLYLKKNWKFIKRTERTLFDYSTFLESEGIENRNLDIRVRKTNNTVELILKKWAFWGASRDEISLALENGDLNDALKYMALLWYRKAVLCIRNIDVYEIDDIEFVIQDVIISWSWNIHSRFFEAEIMCEQDTDTSDSIEKIKILLNQIWLKPFSEKERYHYIHVLNKEANWVFEY